MVSVKTKSVCPLLQIWLTIDKKRDWNRYRSISEEPVPKRLTCSCRIILTSGRPISIFKTNKDKNIIFFYRRRVSITSHTSAEILYPGKLITRSKYFIQRTRTLITLERRKTYVVWSGLHWIVNRNIANWCVRPDWNDMTVAVSMFT